MLIFDLVDPQGARNTRNPNHMVKFATNLSENPWRVSHLLQLLLGVFRVGGIPLVQSLREPLPDSSHSHVTEAIQTSELACWCNIPQK